MARTLHEVDTDELNYGLRQLTRALQAAGAQGSLGLLGGSDGYGVAFENDTFGMHPYCWCEQDDCPWCAPCSCPDEATYYTIDGQRVPGDGAEFWRTGGFTGPGVREVVNVPELQCHWHRQGARSAPNFWHKPTQSWATWYKYIGRCMDYAVRDNWRTILDECLTSIGGPVVDNPDVQAPAYGPAS